MHSRRAFLAKSLGMGIGSMLVANTSCMNGRPQPVAQSRLGKIEPTERVRIGAIGVGSRGSSLLRQVLRLKHCQVTAICDLIPARVERAQRWVTEKGFPKPAGYHKGEYDYRNLCERDDVDLVLVMTPWDWHAPMCADVMKSDKHVATEVPGVRTLDDCWQLVELSEKTGKHCMMLENYCYFREIMTVNNMIRQGLFGNPLHVYAGYQKESLYYNWNSDGTLTFAGEGVIGHWGNVYASHFAGPSAQWLNINRGDCFDYLVSMGTHGNAYNIYAERFFGADHPLAKKQIPMADVSNTMIATKKGRSLSLLHDCRLPRPHRHYFRLQASNGIYEHIEKRLHIQDHSPGGWSRPRGLVDPRTGERAGSGRTKRKWESLENYYERYEHPLWKTLREDAKLSGHGGGDYVMLYRLVQCFHQGQYPDIDVYDLAAWSAILEISDKSAENRSQSLDIPDFTRGAWQHREPIVIAGA